MPLRTRDVPPERLYRERVAAAGEHLENPLEDAGEATPYCSETKPMPLDPTENAQSAGFVLTYGKFRYSIAGGKLSNAAADMIANGGKPPDQGNYLKLAARPDGGFTMTHSRNGFAVTYAPQNLPTRSITP